MVIVVLIVFILLAIAFIIITNQNLVNNRKFIIRKLEKNREYLVMKLNEFNQIIDKLIPENISNQEIVDLLNDYKNKISDPSSDIEKNIQLNNIINELFEEPSFVKEENKNIKMQLISLYEKDINNDIKKERKDYNELVEKFNNSLLSTIGVIVTKISNINQLEKFKDMITERATSKNNSASYYNTEFNINQSTIKSPEPKVEEDSNLFLANKVKPEESEVKFPKSENNEQNKN